MYNIQKNANSECVIKKCVVELFWGKKKKPLPMNIQRAQDK